MNLFSQRVHGGVNVQKRQLNSPRKLLEGIVLNEFPAVIRVKDLKVNDEMSLTN